MCFKGIDGLGGRVGWGGALLLDVMRKGEIHKPRCEKNVQGVKVVGYIGWLYEGDRMDE